MNELNHLKTSKNCGPDSWKDATIIAIHKRGDRKLASNYCPISLTSIFCRMLESIVKTK